AQNRVLLGVEPLPLLADYANIIATYETWLSERQGALEGVLILEPRSADLLIWSVATSPGARGQGLGNRLLAFAESRAHELGLGTMRLYTGEPLASNIAWYARQGFRRERLEDLGDRRLVHMVKPCAGA